jgi:hypothetical protein
MTCSQAVRNPRFKETTMSIASLSIGSPAWSNPSKSFAASETRSQPSRDRCCEASERPRDSERPARLNPLVAAMMEALGSLFRSSASSTQSAAPTGAAPAPSSTITKTDAPATDPSTPASPPAGDLREAALAFAYELYGALRGEGHGRGHGHAYGHERHDKDGYRDHPDRHGGGYGQLAQRLTALAQKLDPATPKPVGAATPPTPTPVSTPTPTPRLDPTEAPTPPALDKTPTPTPAGATTPVVDTRGGIQVTININFGSRGPTDTPEADEPREPPLLSAFKKLLAALDPKATQDPSSLQSPQAKLAAFLRQIAQSLTAETGDANPGLPAAGSLLNVSA